MRALGCCLVFLGSVCSGTEAARKVSCRFLCLEGAEPPPPLLNVSAKGAEITCTVPSSTFSEVTVCTAKGDSISFLGSEDHQPAATATVPANVSAAILVFAPAGKPPTALPWRVFVLEDFTKNFGDGGTLLANFCNQDIRFSIGETTITLQPGKSQGSGRPEKRDAFNMAAVSFQFQQDDVWRTASESLLRFVPGLRYLIFAYVDPASGRLQSATCQDFPTLKAALKK